MKRPAKLINQTLENDIKRLAKSSMCSNEEPPGCKQLRAFSFKRAALSLISSPSLSTISVLIAFSTSSAFAPISNCNPVFQTSITYLAFTIWSPKQEEQIMGTPSHMLSKVEFQPLWVKKPPTAG